ncbi:MAG TPA: hypothetical protein DDY22_17935 [Geobacter sp.]|nr:hypothetical protein [Geobacter sp.]
MARLKVECFKGSGSAASNAGKLLVEKNFDFVRTIDASRCTRCWELVAPTIPANRASNFISLRG